MDVGDRVKLVKGNPFGIEGLIESYVLMSRSVDVTVNLTELGNTERYFLCLADDRPEFGV